MGTGRCVRAKAVWITCAAALVLAGAVWGPAAAQEERQATTPASPQQDEAGADVQRLLDLAPDGAWAALAVDMRQVLASEPMQQMRESGPELPPQFTGTRAVAFFLLPVALPLEDEDPPWCGLIAVAPETRSAWEADLVGDGTEITVEGLTAYEDWDGVRGFVADDLVLMAGDQESFGALVRAHAAEEREGLGEQLVGLLAPHMGATALGGAAIPGTLGDLLPPFMQAEMPSYMLGVTEAAFGARLDGKLEVAGSARMASAEDAQQALTEAQQGVEEAKEELNRQIAEEPMMAMFMQPFFAVLNSLKMEAKGAEFHARFEMEQSQLGAFGSMGMLPLIMFGGLGGSEVEYGFDEEMEDRDPAFDLQEIGLALTIYDVEHGEYPPNLAVLVNEEHIGDADVLVDPVDTEPRPIEETGIISSYEYVGPVPREVPGGAIICYTRKGVHPNGRNVLTQDMTVAFVTEEELHDPEGPERTSLLASYEGVVEAFGGDLTDERRAQLKEFYEVQQ